MQEKITACTEKQAYYFMYRKHGFNKKRIINLLATNDRRSNCYESWVEGAISGCCQLSFI